MDDEQAIRVELEGDLDLYRRDEIASAFPSPENVDRLVVDMRNATLIDSSIIALLMRYRRSFIEAGKEGHDIILVVPPQFRRVFEITGLIKLLTIVTAPTMMATDPLTEA